MADSLTRKQLCVTHSLPVNRNFKIENRFLHTTLTSDKYFRDKTFYIHLSQYHHPVDTNLGDVDDGDIDDDDDDEAYIYRYSIVTFLLNDLD